MGNQKPTQILTSRIDGKLKENFVIRAREAGITPSNLNELLIQKWMDSEGDTDVAKLTMENLIGELETPCIQSNRTNVTSPDSKIIFTSSKQKKFNDILSEMFSKGIRSTTDDELKSFGIKRSWLPYSGTHVYGAYRLVSKSFWKESWDIQRL